MRRITVENESYSIKPVFKLWLEIDQGDGEITVLGKGKTDLLEAIKSTGSIKGASEKLGLNFKTAWRRSMELRDPSDGMFLQTKKGGSKKGGTSITPSGENFLEIYHDLETSINKIVNEKESPSIRITADIKKMEKKEDNSIALDIALPSQIRLNIKKDDLEYLKGDKIKLEIRIRN